MSGKSGNGRNFWNRVKVWGIGVSLEGIREGLEGKGKSSLGEVLTRPEIPGIIIISLWNNHYLNEKEQ